MKNIIKKLTNDFNINDIGYEKENFIKLIINELIKKKKKNNMRIFIF